MKSSHMESPWVTTTHIEMTCGNVRINDAHGKFLLNAQLKLNSNSEFVIKSQ